MKLNTQPKKTWFVHPYARVTCRVTIKQYFNYETNKYTLDKMPSIGGYQLGYLAGKDCEIYTSQAQDWVNRNKHNYRYVNRWFTPKDNDFEEN